MDLYYCPLHLRKTRFQIFYSNLVIEIPINKGVNSYKLKISKIGICN